MRSNTSTTESVLDFKRYLDGVQTRYVLALAHRDIPALNRLNRAANTAMKHLASPSGTFVDLEEYVKHMAHVEELAVSKFGVSWTCSPAQNGDCSNLDHELNQKQRKQGMLGGFEFQTLTKKDRFLLSAVIFILIASTIYIFGITREFLLGIFEPAAILRRTTRESLPVPVVTLCNSRVGIPHSRLLVQDYVDIEGNHHRGIDTQGEYLQLMKGEFDEEIERFWSNPGNESCENVAGDFFPFPIESLNALGAGSQSTQCRACYRFGHKRQLIVNSTQFARSSFLSVFTDSLAHECFLRTKGLSPQSKTYLQDEVFKNINSPRSSLINLGILSRADGGSVRKLPRRIIGLLSSKQLCTMYYFALFPKQLSKIERDDDQIQYEFTGHRWLWSGSGSEFLPPRTEVFPTDRSNMLESVFVSFSRNQSNHTGNLTQDDDRVEIGPDAQTTISLRALDVFGKSRYDIKTSVARYIEPELSNEFGYWRNYRIFWKYDHLITDSYVFQPSYNIAQWFINSTGYFDLLVGICIISVFFLPFLYRVRTQERKQLSRQNSDAYLLRKYRKIFDISVSEDGNIVE